MKIYDAIKQRRKELGYSQEKLAVMVGYADKTAVAKIEKMCILLQHLVGHLRVAVYAWEVFIALLLNLSGADYSFAYLGTRLSARGVLQL